MPIGYINKSRQITRLVDKIASHVLLDYADLVMPGEGETNDLKGNIAHAKGIEAGVKLQYLVEKRSAGRTEQAHIFLAEQEVSGGVKDRIYFVGREDEIVAELKGIVRNSSLD